MVWRSDRSYQKGGVNPRTCLGSSLLVLEQTCENGPSLVEPCGCVHADQLVSLAVSPSHGRLRLSWSEGAAPKHRGQDTWVDALEFFKSQIGASHQLLN